MEEMMVDIVTFVDDEGAEFEMEIIKEFEHKDKTYVLLAEYVEPCDCEDPNCAKEDEEESLYIFEVIEAQDGEIGEEYIAIDDDDLLEELSAVVEQLLFDDEEAEV